MRGALPIDAGASAMRPGSASAAASRAASATLRVNVPSWSSVSLNTCTPENGIASLVGLNPTTPQYAAGRITDPLVCVPIAPVTWPAATAAAGPDDDPPGVCRGFHGFLVFEGSRNANAVVTALPKTKPPARFNRTMQAASSFG